MSFLIAAAVVAVGWWVIKSYAKANTAQAKVLTNKFAGYALLGLAGLLAMRSHFEYALALGALAMGMLGYQQALSAFKPKHPLPNGTREQEPPSHRGKVRMSRDEALRVLGLKAEASNEDIKSAHRRLLKDYHPDKGGTDYIAAKINEAKDVLLN
jgi:hypothetical protein